jgi:hypothetical protein
MMAIDFKEFEAALNDVFRMEYGPKKDFDIRDQALVDGRTWYTVYCTHEASQWIRGQSREFWHEHIHKKWDVIHNTFDIDEKLYTMLALRWS